MVFQKVFLKIITVLLFIPSFSFAQSSQSFNSSVSPESPRPGQSVTVTLSSYNFDLSKSSIIWKLNDKVTSPGIEKNIFKFTASSKGEDVVDVTVTPPNGSQIQKTIIIKPSSLDLLWETVGAYTPPFYKGKALPIKQSNIKITAIPNIKKPDGTSPLATDFSYEWTKDVKGYPGQSGYGKNNFSFGGGLIDTSNIVSVKVNSVYGSAESSLTVKYLNPEILFYENPLTDGPLYQRSINNGFQIKGSRVGIVAEPYFLTKSFVDDSSIKTSWIADGQPIESTDNFLSFSTGGRMGALSVKFKYEDTLKLFRTMEKEIRLNLVK